MRQKAASQKEAASGDLQLAHNRKRAAGSGNLGRSLRPPTIQSHAHPLKNPPPEPLLPPPGQPPLGTRSQRYLPMLASGAPSTGLHTPAQSKDLTRDGPFPSEATSHLSQEETPTADQSSQVKLLQDQIFAHRKLSTLAPLKLTITPEIWAVLEDKLEGDGVRFHYTPPDNDKSGILVITCPTAIHKSIDFLAQPFRRIAFTDSSFLCDTNTDIAVGINAKGTSAKRTPDFAFGSKGTLGREYAVMFECGYSQSEPDLMSRVAMWFGIATVICVITVEFVCRDYSSPGSSKQRPLVAVSCEKIIEDSRTDGPLGSVCYDNHIWAHEIEKIETGVYCRDEQDDVEGATFDLTPGAVDLEASQEFINSELRTSAREFLGDTKFQEIFPESAPFFIDCTRFYQAVQDAKMHDAYCRYVAWAETTNPVVQIMKLDAKSFRSKWARAHLGAGLEDKDGRAGKMQKITGSCLVKNISHSYPSLEQLPE
ncbi:hypothetical protein GGX14DRAFT_391726 [Mycena pura]|uniref:Uncharacterized protein n=1 Tax=Mycena pura TaxID=153505 RepID=A0AAD6VU92_9AGAR|nr:hypothetical protein GGX14DRAFT_391726 [Mycena pura]